MKNELSRDARRFQEWQADFIARRPSGTELVTIGPFRIMVAPGRESDSWVSIAGDRVNPGDIERSAPSLRQMFGRWKAAPRIEYDESAFPDAGVALEAAGFRLEERNPLMACRPATFKPSAAEGVHLEQLGASSETAHLEAFQTIRWTDGGDERFPVPATTSLLKELESPGGVHLLAWLDGEPAGTGVSHALGGAAEIVGVVTRNDRRRRGVAATVTSNLVTRHFAAGGDFVFLDAANDAAMRVYERLGFTRFGSNLVYR